MTKYIVLGTSHIAQQSVKEIKEYIDKYKPSIIALELDQRRLHALISGGRTRLSIGDIKKIGVKGALFVLIGAYVQRKLGRMVGTSPGSEMLQAAKLAQARKIPIALIDQDMERTLRRFSLPWKERMRLIGDIVKAIVYPSTEMKRYGLAKLDLRTVPQQEFIEKMIGELRTRYPSIYRVLIDERNKVMINRLKRLQEHHPDATILVIVGAGHKKALDDALHKL